MEADSLGNAARLGFMHAEFGLRADPHGSQLVLSCKATFLLLQEALAHQLLAAADFVLVPSRFEPCGLVAQAALRYGAVPIVTAVGGLRDLVAPEARARTQVAR